MAAGEVTSDEERVLAAAVRWYARVWKQPHGPDDWAAGEIQNDWDAVHDLATAVEALITPLQHKGAAMIAASGSGPEGRE